MERGELRIKDGQPEAVNGQTEGVTLDVVAI